jgi:predicted small lipoprotein YifL
MRTFAVTLLLALSVAGCGRTPPLQSTSLPDRYYVAEAALHYLLDMHSGHGIERDHYSAYVLEQGEFTSELLASFPNYKPTVTTNIQVSTDSGEALDKATRKPVKLWAVKVREIHGERAVAYVSWFSGSEAAGGATIHLRRKDGRWIIESEKKDWVS